MSGSNRTSPVPTAPSPGATSTKSQKCTAGRVRSIIKEIFAQLFSQVGLCLLVVGYSVMGATVFMSLEQPNELLTRIKVGSTRNQTLDDLYNLTGKCTTFLNKDFSVSRILFRRVYVIFQVLFSICYELLMQRRSLITFDEIRQSKQCCALIIIFAFEAVYVLKVRKRSGQYILLVIRKGIMMRENVIVASTHPQMLQRNPLPPLGATYGGHFHLIV